ncbi:DUF305 domain-containing protein [Streptomyces sp. CAU 1734]|uniref:DUF305 domain-containing protein n=1 Tax=Streptomyces sp. CAU 1734 TaxID=3140360 RepID=UPI003260E8FA
MLNRRRTSRVPTSALAVAVTVAMLTLGACESDSGSDAKAKEAGAASVVAPGKPGEPAKMLTAEEAKKALPDDSPNAADFSYAHMMIEHHAQALVMTELVPKRSKSDKVKRMAERITASQQPEIEAMEGWLKINKAVEDKLKKTQGDGGHGDHGDHAGGSMPGMATPAQLKKLSAAKGAAFDKLFLELMITHHQGAVTMAAEVLTNGNNVRVEEMANDVAATQTSEINRMRDM